MQVLTFPEPQWRRIKEADILSFRHLVDKSPWEMLVAHFGITVSGSYCGSARIESERPLEYPHYPRTAIKRYIRDYIRSIKKESKNHANDNSNSSS